MREDWMEAINWFKQLWLTGYIERNRPALITWKQNIKQLNFLDTEMYNAIASDSMDALSNFKLDLWWFQLVFTASRLYRLQNIYSRHLFASTFVYKTVSSTQLDLTSLQSLQNRPQKRKKLLSFTMIDIQSGSSTTLKVGSRNVTGYRPGRDWNAKGDLVDVNLEKISMAMTITVVWPEKYPQQPV